MLRSDPGSPASAITFRVAPRIDIRTRYLHKLLAVWAAVLAEVDGSLNEGAQETCAQGFGLSRGDRGRHRPGGGGRMQEQYSATLRDHASLPCPGILSTRSRPGLVNRPSGDGAHQGVPCGRICWPLCCQASSHSDTCWAGTRWQCRLRPTILQDVHQTVLHEPRVLRYLDSSANAHARLSGVKSVFVGDITSR